MKLFKSAAAVLTAAIIIFNSTVFCFADSYNTVSITSSVSAPINYKGDTFVTQKGTYKLGDTTYNENIYSVTAKLDKNTELRLASGTTLYGRSTLSHKLKNYQAGDGKRVIAAINGDFFSPATGLPLGLQITDGIIRTSNNYAYEKSVGRWSVGFKADGTAVVGMPNIKTTVTSGENSLTPDRINAYPDTNFTLLTSDYSDKSYWNTAFSHDVVVLKAADSLRLGTTVECTFVSYTQNVTEPVKLEKDHFYLITPTGDTRLSKAFSASVQSDAVTVRVIDSTGIFGGVITGFGAGSLLINDGAMRYPSTFDQSISNTLTSRSAIGIKKDGSVVFYAVEKTPDKGVTSGGVKLEAVMQAMYNMGCVYAVNLDGGGSTTIAAATDGFNCTVKNKCQDGSERRVSNCLFIVSGEVAPTVIEDFEKDTVFTEQYTDTNLVTVSQTENAYTGGRALQLDYTLKGFGSSVSALYETPLDITKYDRLTMTVGTKNPKTALYALTEKEGELTEVFVGKLDFNGYKHFEIDTSGLDKLLGFMLMYQMASDNVGYVTLDRIVGYGAFSLTDTTAPTITVTQSGATVSANSSDGVFNSGKDINGYYFTVDGVSAVPTLQNGGAVLDTSTLTGNKTVRVTAEATDIFGNRARRVVLARTGDFNIAMPFADMKEGKWDENYIRYCFENGVINGIEVDGNMLFKGADSVTRAQFCTMLVRKLNIDENEYAGVKLPYEDISDIPSWAMLYVKAAYAEGIMEGSKTYTGTAFNANSNITRAEAATAIDRITERDTRLAMSREYTDSKDIAKWAAEHVASVTAQGIFDGDTDGKFYPKRNLSRSEAAAILTRI